MDKNLLWFTETQIGPKRHTTPEGYLICEEVPIARVGPMLYMRGEIPLEAGLDGTITVTRDEAQLFDPATMASFNGKPVVVRHPPSLVTRATWRDHAVGHAQNIRRGTGALSDCMVADLLITNDEGIDAIDRGWTQISNGYQAQYKQTSLGKGVQHNIIGNHIAIVPTGRCGTMCAIGDSVDEVIEIPKGPEMKLTIAQQLAKLTKAYTEGDKATMDEMMAQMGAQTPPAGKMPDSIPSPADGPVSDAGSHRIIVNVHGGAPAAGGAAGALGGAAAPGAPAAPVDPITGAAAPVVAPGGTVQPGAVSPAALPAGGSDPQVLNLLQQILTALTGSDDTDPTDPPDPAEGDDAAGGTTPPPPGNKTTDAAAVTLDSVALAPRFQDVLARAEILHPGIPTITFDATAAATATEDSLCTLMRGALKGGYQTEDTRACIDPLMIDKGDKDFTKMTCDALNSVFMAASEMVKLRNNNRVAPARATYDSGSQKAPPTAAEINAKNKAFWAKNSRATH